MKKGIPPIFYAFYEQEWYFSADFRGPVAGSFSRSPVSAKREP